MKAVFWLGIMVLMQISCLRFKQSGITMLIPHVYVSGSFVNIFGDFKVYLETFSERICKNL